MKLLVRPFLMFLVLVATMSSIQAENLPGSIYAIERYNTIKRSYITEPYDVFCLSRPGFMVEIPWDATEIYGAPENGQVVVELINMGMIECKHGWDLHEMGNIRQGSAGTEWVAIYNGSLLVRFTAISAKIVYTLDGRPQVKARVHDVYCKENVATCEILFNLPI